MNSPELRQSQDPTAAIISRVRAKNVRLWSENGELHYRAPKGALTQPDIDALRLYKHQLAAVLDPCRGAGGTISDFAPASGSEHLPLAYSQWIHWRANRLWKRPSQRSVVSVVRLSGQLDTALLNQCVVEIVRRHDALRTQIVLVDGIPRQRVSSSVPHHLEIDDLTALPKKDQDMQSAGLLEKYAVEPVDVTCDPLFKARLLRLSAADHILVLAAEHIISDGWSMTILRAELLNMYARMSDRNMASLPSISVQFPDFALWQLQYRELWLQKHAGYWADQMADCQRLRFRDDPMTPGDSEAVWKTVSFEVEPDVKEKLERWCRSMKTTTVMGVFAAYTALALRWCDTSDAAIGYQISGRDDPRMGNTIGYFSSTLFLRIRLLTGDRFVDLLRKVTEEYCRAYEHVDSGYFEAQTPPPDYTRTCVFNWLPSNLEDEVDEPRRPSRTLVSSQVPFSHPGLTHYDVNLEPSVVFNDLAETLVGSLSFPSNRFHSATMDRFARNLVMFMRALVEEPEARVADFRLR